MVRLRRRRGQIGFTIVELLIVIVVIGVLAAITIVAYNGVQQRARNAQTIAAVNDYIKGYTAYAIDNGSYPIGGNYCIGQGYAGGLCWDNRVYVTPSGLAAALGSYMSNLPNPSTTPVYRNSTDGFRAGILYVAAGYGLRYQLEGESTSCGITGATRAITAGQSTGPECNINLRDPANL